MDIERLYQDYNIHFAHKGDRHYRDGWVNLPCPFCAGHAGNHLGFHKKKEYYKCFRCGHKSIFKVLNKILGVSFDQVKQLIREYRGSRRSTVGPIVFKKIKFTFPDDCHPANKSKAAIQYLTKSRGFSRMDALFIVKRFSLMATGEEGYLNKMDLSHRIIAPIFFKYEVVSWQSRDFTGKARLPYITCPGEVEKKKHKEVLYNSPDPYEIGHIVLCEGIVDVWKVSLAGFPATCCFGVEFTHDQYKLLSKYDKIIIFFDPDHAGRRSTRKLKRKLSFLGKEVIVIHNTTGSDPGEMTTEQIRNILNPYFIIKE